MYPGQANLVWLVLPAQGNSGCSFRGNASSLITSLRPCIGSCSVCPVGGWGSLEVTISSNQVGRIDLTPIMLSEFVFLMLSLRRLWYMGGTIHDGTKTVMNWTFHATCKSLGLKSGVMHLTWPSMILVYDSDRSKDAVTLRPRYNSLNQYSLRNMK